MHNKIIITAGGTSERIDNVRKITNSSTGKLGKVIAEKLIELVDDKIDTIYYVAAKGAVKPESKKIKTIEILDVADLQREVTKLLKKEKIDYFIHAMAVSDYTVQYVTTVDKIVNKIKNANQEEMKDIICNFDEKLTDNKISSNEDNLIIKLKKTPKIISLIKDISPKTYLVGFKLLDSVSEDELRNVAFNLKEKNKCNLVVANDLNNIRNGIHKAFIIKDKDDYIVCEGKEDIAAKLIEEMMSNNEV